MTLDIPVNARTISPFDLKLESHLSGLFLFICDTPKFTGKEACSSPLMRLEWHFLLIGIAQAREKPTVRSELVTLCLLSSTQSRANLLVRLVPAYILSPFLSFIKKQFVVQLSLRIKFTLTLVKSDLGSHSAILKLFICKHF